MELHCADALAFLPSLAAASVDCVITDPPYPHIKRSYGYWTSEEWFALMQPVVRECRRVLKPSGSAVFVLQPNSERVGRMRPWLWDFLSWCCREWNVVQDAYWWNYTALPAGGAPHMGMMRPSVKPCVWLGEPNAYRNQDAVLLEESDSNRIKRLTGRRGLSSTPAMARSATEQGRCDHQRISALKRGGTTPFNLLPIANTDSQSSAGAHGHGAGTPRKLCEWWIRYICPPGGVVLDPFSGSGTTALAALALGRNAIGIERVEAYHQIAQRRIAEAQAETPLFAATVAAPEA